MNQLNKSVRIGALALLAIVLTAGMATARGAGELISTERDLGNFESVRLSAGSVAIEVSPAASGPRLETLLDSRRTLNVTESGGALNIEVFRVRGFARTSRREKIKLFVPHGTQAEIDSGSGSVTVSGVDFSELSIDAGSGSVAVTGSSAEIRIDVGSGSVELADVTGELTISSGSGSVTGDKVTLTGDSLFDTGSGSIEMVFLNAENELSFDLDSGSGSIRVGGIRGADRIVFGSGDIKVTGSSGSGSQRYRTR